MVKRLMIKKYLVFLCVFALLLIGVMAADRSSQKAGASPSAGANANTTGNETSGTAVNGVGGNVTDLVFGATASTLRWAGFVGNVSVGLKLGSSGGGILFDFGLIGRGNASEKSRITMLASPGPTGNFNFADMQSASTNLASGAVDALFNFSATDADSVNYTVNFSKTLFGVTTRAAVLETFNGTTGNSSFALNQSVITAQADKFYSALFVETAIVGVEDMLFVAPVILERPSFRNDTPVDFEMIVPINGTGAGQRQLPYTFFVDVN